MISDFYDFQFISFPYNYTYDSVCDLSCMCAKSVGPAIPSFDVTELTCDGLLHVIQVGWSLEVYRTETSSYKWNILYVNHT